MSDFSLDLWEDPRLKALQGLPGAFTGVVPQSGGTGAQGAPAGHPGPQPGLLNALNPWATLKRLDPYPAYQANKAKGDFPGWGQVLNPLSEWNFQRYLTNKGGGQEAPAETPAPASVPPPVVAPQQASMPAPMPTDPNNPMPTMAGNRQTGALVQQPQQPIVPPPQAAPGQPQQPPAIPPASAAGRTAAAQPQGNPLDQYFQQMMALQRQRMLLGMAGGLLGAPSLGIGLGRAFTNASNTVAPEGDLVTKIAQAQIAGQLERQKPYSTPADVNAAIMGAFAGKPPEFKQYEYKGRTFGQSPAGRDYALGSGFSSWVYDHQGMDKIGGNRVPIEQAATKGNGRYILLDDGKLHDTRHPTFEGSEVE